MRFIFAFAIITAAAAAAALPTDCLPDLHSDMSCHVGLSQQHSVNQALNFFTDVKINFFMLFIRLQSTQLFDQKLSE